MNESLRINTLNIKILGILIFINIFSVSDATMLHETIVPRTVIALYSSNKTDMYGIDNSLVHQFAEMPLNHLGIDVEFYNVNKELPDLSKRPDVRGVITWFQSDDAIKNPYKYLKWANSALINKKRYVIMGYTGYNQTRELKGHLAGLIRSFYHRLGFIDHLGWCSKGYKLRIQYSDPKMMDFERKYDLSKPGFSIVTPTRSDVKSHLIMRADNNDGKLSHLVMTSPRGGYVALEYAANVDTEHDMAKQWYINPFRFFRLAFATDEIPKPDTTTLAGNRIYFSHIDCDGWNSVSLVQKYKNKRTICADVIYEEIIKKNPDLPVSVAIVAGDVALDWYGTKISREVARKIMAMPNVEAASHTYTHPFEWDFFENYTPEKEKIFQAKYDSVEMSQGKHSLRDWIIKLLTKKPTKTEVKGLLTNDYEAPRAYGKKPFSLKFEILGSFKEIETLTPKNKKVDIIMWSGNTRPFEAALRMAREAGVENINGGDSRFDAAFPSFMWVAPIGRQVGKERQIFAVNSNENTYTDLWHGNYHAFKYLPQTFENTEHPFRTKPMNLYYHSYSGERDASLNALRSNIAYIKAQEICPITTSEYSKIAKGFYSTVIYKVKQRTWVIKNRGELQTIRFDNASHETPNYNLSHGIIGHRYYQGSLYIYLDSSVNEPLITLMARHQQSKITRPFLIQSSWQVSSLKNKNDNFCFNATGFGDGKMRWFVPQKGKYQIFVNKKPYKVVLTTDNQLRFKIIYNAINTVDINIIKINDKQTIDK